jgi:radical SAM superfamily enzyme YgiQ (UPF0313 family)
VKDESKRVAIVFSFSRNDYEVIEHIGVEYLSSFMIKLGWEVLVVNTSTEEQVLRRIVAFAPIVVGFSATTLCIGHLAELACELRRLLPSVVIVFGGVGPSCEPEEVLTDFPWIDTVVVGEGERAFGEICEEALQCREQKTAARLGHVGEKRRIVLRPTGDIDSLPTPSHRIARMSGAWDKTAFIAILSRRGCAGGCTFCYQASHGQSDRAVRTRNPELVVDEIEHLVCECGASRFAFLDQTFGDPPSDRKASIASIVGAIEKRKINISFTIQVRAENWREEDSGLIAKLRRAGLVAVYPGLEAADDVVLRKFGKPSRSEDGRRVLRLFRAVGVAIDVGWIMYHPYSSFESLENNLNFLRAEGLGHLGHVVCNELTLYPRTQIVQTVRRDGLLVNDPSFRNRQGERCYRYADERIGLLVESLFSGGSAVEPLRSCNRMHAVSLGWGMLCSIAELEHGSVVALQRTIGELARLKREWFARVGAWNLERFASYFEMAKTGLGERAKKAIDDKCSTGVVDEFEAVFKEAKLKYLVETSRLDMRSSTKLFKPT